MNKKNLLVLLTFSVFFVLSGCSMNNFSEMKEESVRIKQIKEAKKNLIDVKQVVQAYYLNLEKSRYEEALSYVAYNSSEALQGDINWLNNNKDKYIIDYSKDAGNIVGYEYSSEMNQYRVITYITVNKGRQTNESIYVRKIGNDYKIIHIASRDQELSYRSSSNSPDWNIINEEKRYTSVQ